MKLFDLPMSKVSCNFILVNPGCIQHFSHETIPISSFINLPEECDVINLSNHMRLEATNKTKNNVTERLPFSVLDVQLHVQLCIQFDQ